MNQPGARRVGDRRVISGILHDLKTGCRWRDCPKEYGPHTTIYNRFNRWSRRRLWLRILEALVAQGVLVHSTAIDSTYIKAHRSAHGGKGGQGAVHRPTARRPDNQDPSPDGPARAACNHPSCRRQVSDIKAADEVLADATPLSRLIADKGYDADRLRSLLKAAGTRPIIPGRRSRKRPIRYDVQRYRERWRIEAERRRPCGECWHEHLRRRWAINDSNLRIDKASLFCQ